MAEHVADCHWVWVLCIEDHAVRRAHLEHVERCEVVGQFGGQRDEHAVRKVRVGVAKWHVDAEPADWRRAAEIGVHAVVGHGDRDSQRDRLAVAIDDHLVGVHARLDAAERTSGGRSCSVKHKLGELSKIV